MDIGKMLLIKDFNEPRPVLTYKPKKHITFDDLSEIKNY